MPWPNVGKGMKINRNPTSLNVFLMQHSACKKMIGKYRDRGPGPCLAAAWRGDAARLTGPCRRPSENYTRSNSGRLSTSIPARDGCYRCCEIEVTKRAALEGDVPSAQIALENLGGPDALAVAVVQAEAQHAIVARSADLGEAETAPLEQTSGHPVLVLSGPGRARPGRQR